MRIHRAVLPLAAVAALAIPDTAGASIRINVGIDGARLNQTQAQVRAVLGAPSRVIRGSNDFGAFTEFRYASTKLRVSFQGNSRVTAIETTGLGDRTSRGIGVGSTESAVRARVANVHCSTIGGFRSCHVGAQLPGRRVTDFSIALGRVTRVVVGLVID